MALQLGYPGLHWTGLDWGLGWAGTGLDRPGTAWHWPGTRVGLAHSPDSVAKKFKSAVNGWFPFNFLYYPHLCVALLLAPHPCPVVSFIAQGISHSPQLTPTVAAAHTHTFFKIHRTPTRLTRILPVKLTLVTVTPLTLTLINSTACLTCPNNSLSSTSRSHAVLTHLHQGGLHYVGVPCVALLAQTIASGRVCHFPNQSCQYRQ